MARSLKVKAEWLKKVRLALRHAAFPTQKSLAEDLGLALSTVSKFLTGKSVDYATFIEICRRIEIDWQEIADVGYQVPSQIVPVQSHLETINKRRDWEEAIDVTHFYGCTPELTKLAQWIVRDRCRLVAVLGMGGIGKTALAVKLAQEIQVEFEYVIWRSLRNAPQIATLLADLVLLLSDQQETKADIARLLHYLRTCRCLLILDNVETILQPGDISLYLAGYEEYGDLLRLIAETAHQSCLLLTSREKPHEVAALEGVELAVRSLRLSGSSEVAKALLQAKGLVGADKQKQLLSTSAVETLCECYSNNPLALKIVATSIQDLFDGDIQAFLTQNTIIFNSIRRLLEQQFNRLSSLEQTIMYWLAINREWTVIAELYEDILPKVSKANLLEALDGLWGRSLIEKQSGSYTQQPVVMEYVTDSLIQKIITELTTKNLSLLLSYALIKTTAKDYIRASQVRLILQPIAHQFQATFSSTSAIEQQIKSILEFLRTLTILSSNYAAGNLINLCCQLQLDLTGYDFSGLAIWQAFLSQINLHQVNFAYADLAKSIFTETFSDIFCLAFSPDGTFLATGEPSGEIRLWKVIDNQLLWVCKAHTNWVMSVVWSPDGTMIASGSQDHRVKLWEARTGQALKTLQGHTDSVHSLSWHPSQIMIATGSEDHTIRFWDVDTGQTLKILSGHNSWVSSLNWNPDGTILASGSVDHSIKLWNIQTGKAIKTLLGHTDQVLSVIWSPDGTKLASGSVDHTIKLWDVSTGNVSKTLQGHTNWVRSVAWNCDGTILASGGDDCTVKLWDMSTGNVSKTLQGHTNWVKSVAWNCDGTMLASGSVDHTVKFWNIHTGQALRTLQGYTNWLHSIAWSPDGTMIASGSEDQIVIIWDAHTGKALRTLQGHTNWVYSVAWSPDGTMIASGSADNSIKLWNIQTGKVLRTLQGHSNWVFGVDWSLDGTVLVSSSVDNSVKLWDLQTGQVINTLQGHTNWVWSVAWSPNGTMLASASEDHTVKLWDARTGKLLQTLEHNSAVRPLVWSPNGKIIACSGGDSTVKLWDVKTGRLIKTLQEHTNWISSLAWNPDSKIIASASQDCTVKLWDVNRGKTLKTLLGHTSWVSAVAYAPHSKGRILASGGVDEMIKLWDTVTGECLRTFRNIRFYEGMNITGVTGITEAQKATLKDLGAIEI